MYEDIDYDAYKYQIEAENEQGVRAPDLMGRYFKTIKAALNYFDNSYIRRGFRITIYKHDIPYKFIKTTFR